MCSFFKSLSCLVLLGFSIMMPAQNLPSLKKDAAITAGKLQNGISYYLVTDSAMKGVADFALVRKGSADTLAARKELANLPHFNKTIPYRFLSRKGIGCRPEGYISYEGDATIFRFDNVPVFDQEASDTTILMMFDLIAAQPKEHAIIIAGDITPAKIIEKFDVFSLMVPARTTSYSKPEYVWKPAEGTGYSFIQSTRPGVSVSFRSPRTPDAEMNTIQPFISELFARELKEIVKGRLGESLVSRDIPASRMGVCHRGSAEGPGDELFKITVEVPEDQVIPATMAISSTLSDLGSKGVGTEEYRTARASVLSLLSKPQDNGGLVRQCIASYLYGGDLSSRQEKARFFSSRNMSESAERELFNNYAAALLGDMDNASVEWKGPEADYDDWEYEMVFKTTWDGVSMLEKPAYQWTVSTADTTGFWEGKNKSKLKSVSTEPVSGGEMWTFANGMKVIYKQMKTGGSFSYSMMIKGGYSNVRDLPRGEGAFFSDMLSLYDVAGLSGSDFQKVLKANGIRMENKVSVSDMKISGSAPSGRYALVFKALLSIANNRKLNRNAFEEYRRSTLASLPPAYLDSLMYPEYGYSSVKTPSGLTERTQSDADAYFAKQFLRCNDGVIVLVGELPAQNVQKYLAGIIGGFRVSKTNAVRVPLSYKFRKGSNAYSATGEPVSVSIAMACAEPFTTENYMAFKIAGQSLYRKLSGAMAEQGFSVDMADSFKIFPQESLELIFTCIPVPDHGLPYGIAGGADHPKRAMVAARKVIDDVLSNPIAADDLKASKALLSNVYSLYLSDPDSYLDAVMLRYSGGKDVLTDYQKRIGSVTADNVKHIFGVLAEGMKIEYVVKQQ